MYFRKNLKKLSAIVCTIVLMTSCSSDDSISEPSQEEILQIELREQEAALKKFDKFMIKAQAAIQQKSTQEGPIETELEAQQLLTSVSDESIIFMEESGFTYDDYHEMFGTTNIFELQNQIAVAGIWLYALQKEKLINPNAPYTKSKVGNCFTKAVGISAGIATLKAIKGGGGKVLKKALKRLLKRVGAKLVPYLGQVLMAAEFIHCMSTKQISAGPRSTDLKCNELLQFKLLNSHKWALLSMDEVGVSTEIINPNKYYQTHEVIYGNGIIDLGDITTETSCKVYKNTGSDALIKGSLIDKNSIRRYEPLNGESNLPSLLID